MRYILLTSKGEFIYGGVMPLFNDAPKVIMWGSRVFALDETSNQNAAPLEYREVFAWAAV